MYLLQGAHCFYKKKAWIYGQTKGCLSYCSWLLIRRLLASAGCCSQRSSAGWSHCAPAKTLLWNETPPSCLGCQPTTLLNWLSKNREQMPAFFFLSRPWLRMTIGRGLFLLSRSFVDWSEKRRIGTRVSRDVGDEWEARWAWWEVESELLWFVCFSVSTGREGSFFSLEFDTVWIHYTAGLNPISRS